MEAAAEHEIELQIPQRDTADRMASVARAIEVRRGYGVAEAALIRMSVQK